MIEQIENIGLTGLVCLVPNTTYTFSTPGYDFSGHTLFPAVRWDLTIEGNGAIIERANEGDPFRFFSIRKSGLTLSNMTLRGGLLQEGKGAAIYNQATLTLDNVIFDNNCLVNIPCSDDDAIENHGGTVNIIGPVRYGTFPSPTPPLSTLTPTPTMTPIVLQNLTPVILPSPVITSTPLR